MTPVWSVGTARSVTGACIERVKLVELVRQVLAAKAVSVEQLGEEAE